MATAQVPQTTIKQRSTSHIGVVRLAATTGAAAGLIFVLCWLGTFISFASPTHVYISLFTDAETQSIQALVEGGIWSLLFGLLSGGMIAGLYNLFAGLDRR
ncbi:hypothetical protein [Sphingomonas sp.]|uniref:hypothetical protein n=1 Tax=Sphingomonas sp. TaxID=28214 RepID=UPI00286BCC7E|nr:hypothetical protein [Sphingomonas sp.]